MDLAERNTQMNKYIIQENRKALPFSRKPTNECRKIIIWQLLNNILFRQEPKMIKLAESLWRNRILT